MGDIMYITKDMMDEFFDGIKHLRLRKLTPDNITLMFKTQLEGAFRISEVLDLIPNDILDDGRIRIRHSKSGFKYCKCAKWEFRPTRLIKVNKECPKCKGIGKFRIDQFARVKNDTMNDLRDLAYDIAPDKKLFPITRRQALRYINEIIGSRTHALRHTRLTDLLTSTRFNINEIKQIARHTSIQTTDRYIETNDDLVRQKLEKFDNETS